MTLQERFRKDFGDWRKQLPKAWRNRFDGVDLGFKDIDPAVMIDKKDAIWPRAGNKGGPEAADTFKALRGTDPDQVRVVIFGNDPYTRVAQATGRSFEQGDLSDWRKDIGEPHVVSPSLKSILCAAAATSPAHKAFDLMSRDDLDATENGFLWRAHEELARGLADGGIQLVAPRKIFDFWSKQQVLWLNRTLTYSRWLDNHRPNHTALWKPFTSRVIEIILQAAHERKSPVVFALWGGPAGELEEPIKQACDRIGVPRKTARFSRTGHPQMAGNYFRSGNPLAAINDLLNQPIRWLDE